MPNSTTLSLDADGGTRISGLRVEHWQCSHPELSSLDLTNSPELVVLDLSRCPALHHLTVQDCSALETIHLPALGRVTLHLDAGDTFPSLRVLGGLEHVDACWRDDRVTADLLGKRDDVGASRRGGRFSADCEDLAPWQHSVIGDAAFVNQYGQQADLQIQIGDYTEEPSSHGRVCSPDLRHLLVIGCHQLQRLEITSGAQRLETLRVNDAPALESVDLQRKVLRACFKNVRRLAQVEGSTDTLSIKRGTQRDAGLTVQGRHRTVRLVSCGLKRLVMSHPCQLLLMRCPRLTKLDIPDATSIEYFDLMPPRLGEQDRIRIDESLVRQMHEYFIQGHPQGLDELKSLMPKMAGRRQAVHALILLDQLLDEGVSPSSLWALRQDLMARHLFGHLSIMSTPRPALISASRRIWLWNLPQDLMFEGWAADYRLWLIASETDRHAEEYARTIQETCLDDLEGPAITTVVEHVTRHLGRPDARAIDTLRRVLTRLPSAARRRYGFAQSLPQALSWSTSLASHMGRHGPRFDRALSNFAKRTLHPHHFLRFAERAGPLHPLVRDHLTRMAKGYVRYPLPPHEAREMPSLQENARRLLQSARDNSPADCDTKCR